MYDLKRLFKYYLEYLVHEMDSIIKEIIEWVKDRPYWEQYALDCVLKKQTLSENEYQDIYNYILNENGISDVPKKRIELKYLSDSQFCIDNKTRVKIKKISNLLNVNALAPNQTIPFGDQLPVIFGDNGAGKSGYS